MSLTTPSLSVLGAIHAFMFDPHLEEQVASTMRETPPGVLVALPPDTIETVLAMLVVKHEPNFVTANLVSPILIDSLQQFGVSAWRVSSSSTTSSTRSGNSSTQELRNSATAGPGRALGTCFPDPVKQSARRTEARC